MKSGMLNISTALEYAGNFIFPSDIYCAACGNLINGTRPYALCDDCIREINWHVSGIRTCEICGKALAPHRIGNICSDCREWGRSFDSGISCCAYSGKARDMVRAMKYNESAWIAAKIADVMYDRWESLTGIRDSSSPSEVSEADNCIAPVGYNDPVRKNHTCIVHVPMARSKRHLRGYDQAALIAGRLARLLGTPYRGDIIIRSRDTAVMSGLDAINRRANIADAFTLSPYALRLAEDGDLALGNVLLVDDVFTTGSTADACAAVLKEYGARSVTLFTFASGSDVSPAIPDADFASGSDITVRKNP